MIYMDKKDYLEKRYNERFLPIMEDSLYGDHPGKLDLATTRIFTKPYDLSYFKIQNHIFKLFLL